MTTHAPPQAADPDHLTAVLRRAGVLDGDRVTQTQVVHSFPTLLSQFHRVKLDYEGAADAPRHLYFKSDLPGRPTTGWDSGRREVAFYTTVAPATPAGLLPRCFEAEVAADGTWHLLLEDLTDTHTIATQWPLPPTVTQAKTIVRCRARFQAAWWDHPRLGVDVGSWPSDPEIDNWNAGLVKANEAFADALGDRLPPHRRELYERLFANAPRLQQRYRSDRHRPLV